VLSALIAVAGSLLGVALGFFAQHLQADLAHRRHLDDLKREAYAELLRAVSASYAQASSGGGTSEDAALLKATAVIQLLAGSEIGSAARNLERQVGAAHALLRQSGYEAARAKIDAADQSRLELIRLFKADLGFRRQSAKTLAPASTAQPGTALTSSILPPDLPPGQQAERPSGPARPFNYPPSR
jgi:hypothetical protein